MQGGHDLHMYKMQAADPHEHLVTTVSICCSVRTPTKLMHVLVYVNGILVGE